MSGVYLNEIENKVHFFSELTREKQVVGFTESAPK